MKRASEIFVRAFRHSRRTFLFTFINFNNRYICIYFSLFAINHISMRCSFYLINQRDTFDTQVARIVNKFLTIIFVSHTKWISNLISMKKFQRNLYYTKASFSLFFSFDAIRRRKNDRFD